MPFYNVEIVPEDPTVEVYRETHMNVGDVVDTINKIDPDTVKNVVVWSQNSGHIAFRILILHGEKNRYFSARTVINSEDPGFFDIKYALHYKFGLLTIHLDLLERVTDVLRMATRFMERKLAGL